MRLRTLRYPRLLRRETPRKRCPGSREDARGAVCYTSQLRIGAWICEGLSNVTMTMCKDLGFDIRALSETQKWRSDTDAIFSEHPEDGDPYSGRCIWSLITCKGRDHVFGGDRKPNHFRTHSEVAGEPVRDMRIRQRGNRIVSFL